MKYKVKCLGCKSIYIRKTGRKLKMRLDKHATKDDERKIS